MQTERHSIVDRFQGRDPQLDIAPTASGTLPQVDAFMLMLRLAFVAMCFSAIFGMAGRYLEVSAFDYIAYASAGIGVLVLFSAGAIVSLGCRRRDVFETMVAKAAPVSGTEPK